MNTPTVAEEWERQLTAVPAVESQPDLLALPENRFLAPLVTPGLRILEAGSGNGRYVFAFAKAGAIGVGIDFSRQLIQRMLAEAEQRGLANVTGVEGDILNLPFGDASFDLYTSFGVYEHFIRPQHAMLFREAWRVLKPGGWLYLEVPHLWSAWTVRRAFRYWFRKFGSAPLVWQRNLGRRYLARCGERAGFQMCSSHVFDAAYGFEKGFSLAQATHFGLPNPFHRLRRVFNRIAGRCDQLELLGHTLVYIGRKPCRSK